MFAVNRLTLPASLLMIVQQAGQVAEPVVLGLAIDRAIGGTSVSALFLWIGLLAGLYAVLTIAFRFAYRLEILAMQLVCYQLRLSVAAKVLDPGRSTQRLPGVALSVFTHDVNRLGTAPSLLVYPVGDLAAIVFVAVVLFTISWPLGLVVSVGTPLLIVAMGRAGAPLRRHTRQQQESIGDATGAASDLLAGIRVLKGIGAERVAASRYRSVSQEALGATLRAKRTQAIYSASTSFVVGVFLTGVIVLMGWLALRGDLTVGELIAAVGLTQFVVGPVQSLTNDFGVAWATALGSADRVLGIMQSPVTSPSGSAAVDAAGVPPLRLRGVGAGPIDGLNLSLEPGECVGVLSDGGTAHVLEEILSRRRPVSSGEISIAGRPISTLRRDDVDRLVLVAPHAADLFDGTILENVCPSDDAPTGAALITATRAMGAAACADMLDSLPNGAETRVGEAGARLSGGQRQRVALARALAVGAPVLILHEPTTAVDSVTESDIASRLREFRDGLSTLIITTSPALLAVTDRVVWLQGGQVLATGSHSTLMGDPMYAATFE